MAPPEGCFDREVGVASADRLPIREFSLLRSLAPALASYDGATELERGLDILLNIGIKVLALRGDYSKDAEAQQTTGGEDQA
jgi:threonine/homoserine efflux transporter RhtA